MTNTAQFSADIIEQWGKDASRVIGEMTSDWELGFKKIEVFLKTWLGGGQPWKALDELDERLDSIDDRIAKSRLDEFIETAGGELSGKKSFMQTVKETLTVGEGEDSRLVYKGSALQEYFDESALEAGKYLVEMKEIIAGEKGLEYYLEQKELLPTKAGEWDKRWGGQTSAFLLEGLGGGLAHLAGFEKHLVLRVHKKNFKD